MTTLYLLLLIGAVVCFIIAAFVTGRIPPQVNVNFVALGLALWVLVPLIRLIDGLD